MAGKHKAYSAYKDSGIEWIGDIPEHWESNKLKHLFYEKKHTSNMSLNCGAISFGEVVEKGDEKIPEATKKSYQEILEGEFLINPLNLNYDLKSLRIALSKINVVVSAGYLVLKEKVEIKKGYFKYLLRCFDITHMKLMGSGVRQTINFGHIADSVLLNPPLAEQQAIVDFLDAKSEQINSLIEKKQKQIELLQEKRAALISHTVGGNFDFQSGKSRNFLRNDHSKYRLKYFLKMNYGDSLPDDAREHGDVTVYGSGGAIGKHNCSNTQGTAIIVGRKGSHGKVTWAEGGGFCIDTAFYTDSQSCEGNLRYAYYLLQTIGLDDPSKDSAVPGLDRFEAYNKLIPKIDLATQQAIVNFLDKETAKIDNLANRIETSIAFLEEYRIALITSAVTGTIDVRAS